MADEYLMGQDLDGQLALTMINIRQAAVGTEPARLDQVIALIAASTGASQNAVIGIVDNTAPPPTEVDGDRYIIDNTGATNILWDGGGVWDIMQFNGTSGLWEASTPEEGWTAYVDDVNSIGLFQDDPAVGWVTIPLYPSLAQVLAEGFVSGANDIVMSNQQKIQFNVAGKYIHEVSAGGALAYVSDKGHQFTTGTATVQMGLNDFSAEKSGASNGKFEMLYNSGIYKYTDTDSGFSGSISMFTGFGADYIWAMPAATGTVALTSDLAGVFGGAGADGLVPDPVAETGKFLKDDGTWAAIAGGGDLLAANNLSDVAAQQTAINNVTAVAGATNEYVLTKDTATGDAIWKAIPSTPGTVSTIAVGDSPYAASNNETILSNAVGGNITINLPAASSGAEIKVKKIDASANTITLDGNLAETIDGQLTSELDIQWESFTIKSDGSNWFIF